MRIYLAIVPSSRVEAELVDTELLALDARAFAPGFLVLEIEAYESVGRRLGLLTATLLLRGRYRELLYVLIRFPNSAPFCSVLVCVCTEQYGAVRSSTEQDAGQHGAERAAVRSKARSSTEQYGATLWDI